MTAISEPNRIVFRIWSRIEAFFESGFFTRRHVKYPLVSSLIINIIIWILILIKIQGEDKPVPLHFNAFYGIELVGSGLRFFVIPIVGLALFIVNLLVAKQLHRSNNLYLAVISGYGSLVIQTALLIAALAIARLIS